MAAAREIAMGKEGPERRRRPPTATARYESVSQSLRRKEDCCGKKGSAELPYMTSALEGGGGQGKADVEREVA